VVQVRVVQDDQTRVLEEIGPREIVAACVAELIDDEVVRRLVVQPYEVVRRAGWQPASLGRRDLGGARDEDVDCMRREQTREHIGRVVRDAAPDRRQGGEPGEPHRRMICRLR
jgi:hypothetical protein